jgi:hypothetical protein
MTDSSKAAGETRAELVRIGDRLQSEASRLAEWVLNDQRAPYEVMGAAAGAMSAVNEWTELCAELVARASRLEKALEEARGELAKTDFRWPHVGLLDAIDEAQDILNAALTQVDEVADDE